MLLVVHSVDSLLGEEHEIRSYCTLYCIVYCHEVTSHRAGASYFRLLWPLRALSVKKLGGSGGMLPQEKILN